MKKITLENYRDEKYYPRVVSAMALLLERDAVIRPIDVFAEIGLLDRAGIQRWRSGQAPYLERVLACNLAQASRILRIVRMHAHDLGLRPSHTQYKSRGRDLRFSVSGEANIEAAYARHFVGVPARKDKNRAALAGKDAGATGSGQV